MPPPCRMASTAVLGFRPWRRGQDHLGTQVAETGKPYLSDDFSFIRAGKVHPYITPMRIGLKNILINPVLKDMPLFAKVETALRTALRRMSLGRPSSITRPR